MNLLFICTGNTCRSPMAAALLRAKVTDANLGISVRSAGTGTVEGDAATDHAITVMWERNMDLSGHIARKVDRTLVRWADLILCMEDGHVRTVLGLSPDCRHVYSLRGFLEGARNQSPGEVTSDWIKRLPRRGGSPGISDPIGLSIEDYRSTADELEALIGELVAIFRPTTPSAAP